MDIASCTEDQGVQLKCWDVSQTVGVSSVSKRHRMGNQQEGSGIIHMIQSALG